MKTDTNTERAFRRRLGILVLLHSGPQTYSQLATMLNADGLLELEYDKTQFSNARELPRALQRDIAALRQLNYVIEHQADFGGYALHQSPFGLSLSDEQLVTFATLQTSFRDSHTIHAHDISILLSHLAALLPPAQRQKLDRPPTFTLNLRETTDYRNADGHNLSQIEQAIRLSRQLEFLYCTPRDGKERNHLVEPRPLVYEEGHVYLYGWSIRKQKELRFRLDRIRPGTAALVGRSSQPSRPAAPTHRLRYRLAAEIARGGVSSHFSGQQVEAHPDGSATVTAEVGDLLAAERLLSSYRELVIVLEPPVLVARMRASAAALHKMYCTDAA